MSVSICSIVNRDGPTRKRRARMIGEGAEAGWGEVISPHLAISGTSWEVDVVGKGQLY